MKNSVVAVSWISVVRTTILVLFWSLAVATITYAIEDVVEPQHATLGLAVVVFLATCTITVVLISIESGEQERRR